MLLTEPVPDVLRGIANNDLLKHTLAARATGELTIDGVKI